MAAAVPAFLFLLFILNLHPAFDPPFRLIRADDASDAQFCSVEDDSCTSPSLPPPPSCREDPSTIALAGELERAKKHLLDLEESLSGKDVALQEKHKAILSLEAELEESKKDKDGDLDSALESARSELKALEAKVAHLEDDLQKKALELTEFKNRVNVLEAAEAEHVAEVGELEKLVAEQKSLIEKAEHALHAAEATLIRVQEEADAKSQELLKAHGVWLPPWAYTRLVKLQASTAEYWAKYAHPHWNTASEKASEAVSSVHKWSKPHSDLVQTHFEQKWVPVLKQWSSSVTPHVEKAKNKVAEGYDLSKDLYTQQMEKVQSVVGPHLKVAKEACSPYVEVVAGHVRPHVEQVQALTKPYFKKAFRSYSIFLTSATNYHSQLQASVQGRLKKIDFLEPLASKELVWFLASALLLLPVLAIFILFSSAFSTSKKPAKVVKGHHHGHAHKKAKRTKQVDK